MVANPRSDMNILTQYALVFIPGLVVGRIFDMGYTKLPLFCASLLIVAATFLTAQCTQYWQFLLCQGFAIGVWITLLCSDSMLTTDRTDCVRGGLQHHSRHAGALV